MKNEITDNLHSPEKLESLYRNNKEQFKNTFLKLYEEYKSHDIVKCWYARLNYYKDDESKRKHNKNELMLVIFLCLLAGTIAKIPQFIPGITDEHFYMRNSGFIFLPIICGYFLWKHNAGIKQYIIIGLSLIISCIYINVLPGDRSTDTLQLACLYLPLFIWSLLGLSYISCDINSSEKRMLFIKFNGDVIVLSTIILISGGILAGITLALFSLIHVGFRTFYMEYIVIYGIVATPIVATYVIQVNKSIVDKVSPLIAKIFTPLSLITLVVYLFTIILTGKDPYNDREFLIIFNFLLIGVMALTIFSISEGLDGKINNLNRYILCALAAITIIINIIALSAIFFRINEYGFTPNRLAVLGSNVLIFINLLLILIKCIKVIKSKDNVKVIEASISQYLPFYTGWSIIVIFIFPFLFSFK